MDDGVGERGQIILIAAFAIAVTFVALALVVNSAIFTENLASRGETSGSDDSLVVRHEIDQSVGEAIGHANTYNTSSESDLEANVTQSVVTIDRSITRQQSANGKIVTIEGPTAFNHGTRIRDNVSGGGSDFTGGSGAADWRVADGVEETRAFKLNISDPADGASDNFGGTESDEFQINISSTSTNDEWRVNITNETGTFTVGIREPNGDEGICQVAGSPDYVHVDLTRGLVDDEPCPDLNFGAGIDGSYDIIYNNSDQVVGNYSVVVGKDGHTNIDLVSLSSLVDGTNPYTTEAIYSANVTYRYDGPALTYNTSIRVAPGEPR